MMVEKDIYAPPAAELVNASDEINPNLADRGSRLGAAMIDGVLSGIIVFPAMYFTGYWQNAVEGNISIVDTMMMLVLGFVVFLALHGHFLAKNGQTIGKKMLGIKIVSTESGQIVPLSKLFLTRYVPINVASAIPVIGSIFPLVDILFIFRKDRRCVHDLIAGTSVVRLNES